MSAVTNKDARKGLESLGMWMDTRYNSQFVGTLIQTWDIPRKEKGFFTVYAMNLMLESDGFASLAEQKSEDVEAFIDLLHRLGAEQTSAFVRDVVATLKRKAACDEDKCTSDYYELFEREKVWLKLLDYVGRTIYMRYLRRAQKIEDGGGSTFDAKRWQC